LNVEREEGECPRAPAERFPQGKQGIEKQQETRTGEERNQNRKGEGERKEVGGGGMWRVGQNGGRNTGDCRLQE